MQSGCQLAIGPEIIFGGPAGDSLLKLTASDGIYGACPPLVDQFTHQLASNVRRPGASTRRPQELPQHVVKLYGKCWLNGLNETTGIDNRDAGDWRSFCLK